MGANFYGELVVRITSETSGLSKGMTESAAKVQAAGRTMAQNGNRIGMGLQNLGRTMTQFVTLPVVAGFAVAGVAAFKFEDALMKIQNLTGTNAAQTKAWGEELLKLGPATGQTPTALANALYFVASSGFKGAEAMKVVNSSAKAAAAGMGDVMVTADVLTSAMNAYGHSNLTAAHATDILMKTVQVGKAEPVALASSLGRIMPIAAQLKVNLDELGGNVAALTLGGLSSAEAVTALRGTMMALVSPAKMSIDQLKTMGLTYQDVTDSIAKKGLLPTLKMLWEGVDHNMLSMKKLIPNVRATTGVMSLLGANYKNNLGVIDQVTHSQGMLDAAMKNTAQQPVQKLRQAWASLVAEFIKVGAIMLPVFAQIAQKVVGVLEAFNGLTSGWRSFILTALAVTAVIGPLLMILGSVLRAVALIGPALGIASNMGIIMGARAAAAAEGVSTLGATFGSLLATIGPVGIALGAIAISAAAVWGATKLFDWLDGTTKRIGEMRTAAKTMAADTSIKEWVDKNFGGSLVSKGRNDFVFKPAEKVDAPTSLLANWVKTNEALALVAQREGEQTRRAEAAKGMVAYYQQEIKETQSRRDVLARVGGGGNPYIEKQLAAYDDYLMKMKGKLAGSAGIWRSAQQKLKDMKLKDQAIVFTAKMTDLKNGIADTKKRIKELTGKPHTINTLLNTQKAKEHLSDLKAGLERVAGKSYQVRIQARIEMLQAKVDTAKRALQAIPKREHIATVTADITKLTNFVSKGEARLKKLNQQVTKPTLDADPTPALSAIQSVTNQLNALASRPPTIVTIQGKYSGPGKLPTDSFGGFYRKPRLTVVGDNGPKGEVVLPLDKPARVASLVRQSGLDRMLQPARGSSFNSAAPSPAPAQAAEVHYHSHLTVPQGIVVDDAERFAERLAPWQDRNLATAERRRERGLVGL